MMVVGVVAELKSSDEIVGTGEIAVMESEQSAYYFSSISFWIF